MARSGKNLPKGAIPAQVIVGRGMYFMGVIDILQEWNWFKKLEVMAKRYWYCKESFSVQPPLFYGKRFMVKMAEVFGLTFSDILNLRSKLAPTDKISVDWEVFCCCATKLDEDSNDG